jgi:hypothetical protein
LTEIIPEKEKAIKYVVTCISKEDPEVKDKILFTNEKSFLAHLETNGVEYDHLVELVYEAISV